MLLGINTHNHDASVCLVNPHNHEVVFAAHAERYSRQKNDSELNAELIEDMLDYGEPTQVCWFEKPFSRNLRQLYSGEGIRPYSIKNLLKRYKLGEIPIHKYSHHENHAAQAFYTSGMRHAGILVIDAIGEWDTTSIWTADNNGLQKRWNRQYPSSMGLFYSAITQALGFKPNEEEYIVMGMAALGSPIHAQAMRDRLFTSFNPPNFRTRRMHKGIRGMLPAYWRAEDIAASAQLIWQDYLLGTVMWMRKKYNIRNLIIAGGGALNCVANDLIRSSGLFDEIYVPPNPGDAGLALGAIAAHLKAPIKMKHAYLGYDIRRRVPVDGVISLLEAGEVVGIANGRAEWGPRALGNRSLLADPRGPDVKDRVNAIKKREEFRPFAPAVLDEYADSMFEIDHNNMDYMQFAVRCYDPESYPAICHVDDTSRVQMVNKNNPSILRTILEVWHARTGCPMLLNTSLNIKGEPLVNSVDDARRFSSLNNVVVF
jgi:carbamoyltransferase